MTATAWAIKDWNKAFETFKTRRYQSGLDFIKVPVGTQSAGYKMVMATPGGVAAYAVFVALCQTAARAECRGILAHDGQAMSVRRLSVETLIPPEQIEAAIKILSDPEIGWLKMVPIPTDGRCVWDNDRHAHPETDEDHAETMRGACADHPVRIPDHVNPTHKTKHNQTKQNKTPPPPDGRGVGGVVSLDRLKARAAGWMAEFPWLTDSTARRIARLNLKPEDTVAIKQAAAKFPANADHASLLVKLAQEYAHDNARGVDPPRGQGRSGDRADEGVSGGAA